MISLEKLRTRKYLKTTPFWNPRANDPYWTALFLAMKARKEEMHAQYVAKLEEKHQAAYKKWCEERSHWPPEKLSVTSFHYSMAGIARHRRRRFDELIQLEKLNRELSNLIKEKT